MSDPSRVVAFTAVAIFCSQLLQSRQYRRTELISEALCWLLVPILLVFGRHVGIFSKQNTPKQYSQRGRSLCIIAGSIAVFNLCKAEADILWILVRQYL
jgi:hypothetical protein